MLQLQGVRHGVRSVHNDSRWSVNNGTVNTKYPPGDSVADTLTVPFQSLTCISRLVNPSVPSSKFTCRAIPKRQELRRVMIPKR